MEYAWVEAAAADIGQHEITGPKSNAVILKALDMADGTMDGKNIGGIKDDDIPWCSSWLCGKFEEAGVKSARTAWAQGWAQWGQKLTGPAVGCVVVFRWSPSAGHVGIVMGKNAAGSLMVLGGNQADAVNVKAFGTGQVLAYRWPDGYELPKTVGLKSLPVVNPATFGGSTGDNAVTKFSETR